MTKPETRVVTEQELHGALGGMLDEVERGVTHVVTRQGRPAVILVPIDARAAHDVPVVPDMVQETRAEYATERPNAPLTATALTRLIGSAAARSVLSVFLLDPDRRVHQREVARKANVGLRSAQLALERLENLGLIMSERDGNRRYYRAQRTERFEELRRLLSREFGLVEILARTLEPVRDRIRWAFIFGSAARGDDRIGSDVDLVVVGEVTDDELSGPIAEAQRELAREIDVASYRPERFAARAGSRSHFISSVLAEPRIDVIGGPDDA
jgi:predicted nucleotidyltransferase/antitoxin (DNA-binding transcriptional repressor) of toxin-antitoxin stability system